MKPPMRPLGPFRDQMITVSGMEAPYGNSIHLGASSAFLNGVGPVGRNGAAIESAKTLDQFIADKHAGDTPFPSLEIGTESLGTSVGSCDDFACIYFNALSWRNETTPRTVEINPRITFERMFGEAGTPEQRLARLERKQSMLDSVAGEALKLQQELGPADNRILTEYLENIRQVERQLEQMEKRSETADIEIPTSPIGIPESFDEYLTLSYDLMHLAFQGDITRVFTFLSGLEASDRSYAFIGVPEAHHTMSHHGNDPEKLEKYTKIGTYHVMKFSQFLGKLAATPDGDGSILDHSVLYWGKRYERWEPARTVQSARRRCRRSERPYEGWPSHSRGERGADRESVVGSCRPGERRTRKDRRKHRAAGPFVSDDVLRPLGEARCGWQRILDASHSSFK